MSMIDTVSRPGALKTNAPASLKATFSSLPTTINSRLPAPLGICAQPARAEAPSTAIIKSLFMAGLCIVEQGWAGSVRTMRA